MIQDLHIFMLILKNWRNISILLNQNNHKRSKSQTIKGGQQTLKTVKSALKADNLNTEETTDESFYHMKDYNSNNNPNLYRGSNKNVFMNKNNKIKRILTKKKGDKSQHFMSYDVRSLNI